MAVKERFNFWDIPEDTERLFSTDEVGKILNQKPNNVSSMVYRTGIKRILRNTPTGRTYFFDYKALREIKDYYDRRNKERAAKGLPALKAPDTTQYSLEELKEMHPLVKDDRCFKLSWWPNIVPKCFEDLGD